MPHYLETLIFLQGRVRKRSFADLRLPYFLYFDHVKINNRYLGPSIKYVGNYFYAFGTHVGSIKHLHFTKFWQNFDPSSTLLPTSFMDNPWRNFKQQLSASSFQLSFRCHRLICFFDSFLFLPLASPFNAWKILPCTCSSLPNKCAYTLIYVQLKNQHGLILQYITVSKVPT